MDIRQQICSEAQRLPDFLAKEVLDFIGYIVQKHRLDFDRANDLKKAQQPVMSQIWDNLEDEVWNDA